jgi:hypothetical protein
MNLHDAWTALRHGGNLLSPAALDGLPAPERPSRGLADGLRSALVALDPEKSASAALGALLDVLLEDACGLRDGWQKGNALGAADAEKLLDGKVLKPQRRWTGPGGEVLAVFATPAPQIGVGKGRRPAAQVVEYLRRRSLPLALLTNGRQWRLIWADTDSLAWAEWEAERWLAADLLSDELAVLRRVLAPTSLLRADADLSPLLGAIRDTRRGQGKLSKELGERVRQAVELLLLSRQALVAPVWENHQGADLYVAACHFVMRLVVTLFAEARELLPVDNRVYHQAYGLRGLLDQLDRLSPERRKARHMAWPRLLALFRLLHQGSLHEAMPLQAYGGDLLRAGDEGGDGVQRALALLESLPEPPDDDVIHRVLILLTRTTQKVREGSVWRTVAAPVDFTELTSEYIGILYEGLLDYELHRAGAEPVLFLNLGDQPALPLDRLEAMDDKALAALVENAQVKKKVASGDEKEEDEGEAEDAESSEEDEDAEEAGDPEESDAPAIPDAWNLDDARIAAHSRAVAWGRRAVKVGTLVKKPKSLTAEARVAWNAQLDAAAEQLVADVKLPDELYLVRWGGTRKGAGTFYTRPQLTLPTVRRTLEPLIYEQEGSKAGMVRPPEELLSLKVCDPAMGSGSFLVAALRVLTEAVVESLHVHERIERTNGRTTVDCELLPEADRSLPTEGFEERLEAIVRRAVVEHCLYGVDIDPLAVELARVALWVETLDPRLPFTFLDHKLRCGNALVGTWLDRFRDYPLLCFDRVSPDRKYKGVHHAADVWHEALKEKRAQAIAGQVEILTGQLRLQAATSDEELKTAVERVRRLYRELRAVPAARPDERARIWRERIKTDAALGKVREAFDTWCALWFWPLDELDTLPLPAELHAPTGRALQVVKSLAYRQRFFHWELEFPDVFTREGAGFDVVAGNPPWDTQKPSSKEFFSNHDPLYRAYSKVEALAVQRTLFETHSTIEAQWLAYNGDFKDRGNFVRNAAEPFGDGKVANHGGGDVNIVRGHQGAALHKAWQGRRARYHGTSDPAHPFRHQGSADLNSYKMFVEAGHALLRLGGQLGLVVPSGLYTDQGTGELRKLLLNSCRWRWLYSFENRNTLFDIHRSFKFCVAILEKGGSTRTFQAAFMRHDLEDWTDARGARFYPADRVRAFSPKSLSVVEIRSEQDLAVLTKIYASGVLIGDSGSTGWGIETGREFHMTDNHKLFIRIDEAESEGYVADKYGRWSSLNGEYLVPIYQGVMIGQLEPNRAAWVSGTGSQAAWEKDILPGEPFRPQFLIPIKIAQAVKPNSLRPRFLYRNIARTTDVRTFVGSHVPAFPSGHSVAHLSAANATDDGVSLSGILASLTFDWQLRERIGGTNLSWAFLEEAALPPPAIVGESLRREVLRLIATGEAYADQWGRGAAMKSAQRPWRRLWAITPHERLRLRCILDAIVVALYGLDRDDFAWILKDCDHPKARLSDKTFCRQLDPKGFWRVDKTEDPELRHTVLSLVAFDDLQAVITTAGNRDAGIQAFCDQNEGDGWMLPETLCLADFSLTRTVAVGEYDECARTPQPVRSRLGERFLDWQLAQTPEESWAECERHAKVILEGLPAPPAAEQDAEPAAPQPRLPGMEH